MVKGLEKFREYFKDYPDSYVIIGGTACDMIIDAAGLTPRATKDIDIILVIEALKSEFVKQFWVFIKDGNYEIREKSPEERKYYRFMKPANADFPKQVELFSRTPDLLDLKGEPHLTPIPAGGDLSSLSAILMIDDYYRYTIENSTHEDELHRANNEALICLKACAYLDLLDRKAKGEKVDERDIRKHKGDVFRMAVLLAEADRFELPARIKTDFEKFIQTVRNDLPDPAMFKEMGVPDAKPEELLQQLINNFGLKV